jgi:hypothetical protein
VNKEDANYASEMEAIMKTSTNFLCRFSLAILLGSAILGANAMTADTAGASPYFRCPPQLQFQVKNKAVRCYRGAHWSYKSLKKCPQLAGIGYGLVQDYKNGSSEDFCVTQAPANASVQLTRPTICPKGYRKQIRPKSAGVDRCRKRLPPQIIAPNLRVNR